MKIEPVTLEGQTIRLEPMSEQHLADLIEVGLDPEVWKYMRYGDVRTAEDMRVWMQSILKQQSAGTDLAFTVVLQPTGRAVGCTRYLHIELANRSVEIGGTWYAPAYQRTGVNTEAKYLLLRHAFETLGCVRVHFKADARNERSQRAIERLGAVKEGILRNHMILPDGYIRSSAIYSILAEEWPQVKADLEAKMRS